MDSKDNYNKGFSKIDKVLSKTAKEYNLEAVMRRHRALKHWHEAVSAFIEEYK